MGDGTIVMRFSAWAVLVKNIAVHRPANSTASEDWGSHPNEPFKAVDGLMQITDDNAGTNLYCATTVSVRPAVSLY